MVNKDYYEILGVSKSAEIQEIKRAYKRLAMKYHPDRNRGNKIFEEKFKEIQKAYEVLSDPKKKSMYDQYGHSDFDNVSRDNDFASGFHTTTDFSDVFGDVFGDIFGSTSAKKKHSKAEGSDLLCKLKLTLEESVFGTVKNVKINVIQKCSVCRGSGSRLGTERHICSTCQGQGNVHMQQGFFTIQQTCPTCHGECYVINDPCYICRGNGKEKSFKNFSIKIPGGVNDNDRIRLIGKGHYGGYGFKNGDLYIKVKVKKHNIFVRDGNNLLCKVPINFAMAALGGEIEVPTLYGKIKLKIPLETQTGKIFRIKGKGIKSIKNNVYGDLLCEVYVETPINLNNYQKQLLRNLGFSLFGYSSYEKNNIKSKNFFNRVKRFFDNLAN